MVCLCVCGCVCVSVCEGVRVYACMRGSQGRNGMSQYLHQGV